MSRLRQFGLYDILPTISKRNQSIRKVDNSAFLW